ncbi:iron-containing alcohol dehydrogenase [Lihuaxuella thermophila]|uniref:Alcohol dehydrogenase, class IV n=1 Tax=Lihuaxuella thermophila TaxID=1173111 RepID=A0A1H8CHT0_9BACL|nr:iron-containing alcohol dehydrogenase [Lihuaxuella thermophila]SEM93828.1 Alcohol dehydrogenase, class IV [Lihuaxuella thermophila]
MNEFRVPPVILYGRGSLSQAGDQAASLGRRALIISDRVMEKLGYVKRCEQLLDQAGVSSVSYPDVNSETTDQHVAEALEILQQEKCDLLVAIGGGSCLDAAKAVSIVAKNGGYIRDYMGGKRAIIHPPVPMIAIPTTAGTGSEVTSAVVVTNTTNDVKMMIKHPAFIPKVAIVDPVLTVSSPPHVTAATGIDALCHAVEAYLSRRAQPVTDSLALSSIRLIGRNIRTAYKNGSDLEAREHMAIAAMQAGMAFSNASVCLVHGMSRPIGAVFHVPHGISNAMLLPAVLEFSKEACIERLAAIGRVYCDDLKALADERAADEFVSMIKQLCLDLNIPNMKEQGIDRAKLEQVVDKMAADALESGSPAMNPRIPTHAEIVELYRVCYDYNFQSIGNYE